MSDWKPTLVKIVSILAVLTLILMFNANNFDESEMKVLTWFGGFLGLGGIAEVLGARKVAPALLAAATVLAAQPAEAGLFSRIFNRGCPNGQCSRPAPQKAAPKYRYECSNGSCRRVEIKQ
jgi:hypothetical protein